MVMIMCPDRLKLWRRGTAMRRLTTSRFKLNRRMSNMKSLPQSAVDIRQNAAALGHRHLGDRHMARQSMRL